MFAVLNVCLDVNVLCCGSINCCYRYQCPQNVIYWEKSTVSISAFWDLYASSREGGARALQIAPWVVRVLMSLYLTQV